MDAGASVAGFIGLAGLVAQSTTSLIRLVQDIRNTPATHQSNLKWLEQLSCVLNDLQNTSSILQQAKLTIDLTTMEENLRGCREAIDVLRPHLEKSLDGLRSSGFEKRKATLKAYFGSRNANCQIQDIRRAMENLRLCHSSITGQITVHSYRSTQEQINDLTLVIQDIRRNTQQQQHATQETLQVVQDLKTAQEWMATVQGVLPLEIRNLVRNAIAEELRSASQDQQTPSNEGFRKQTLSLNPGIQNALPLERPVTAPTSPKLDNTSDYQSFEQFQEMEKDFLPRYQNRDDGHTTFLSNMQEQRPYIKSKILMFSWYYRAFFGYFSVVVSERHQVTAGREENVLHIEIRIFPWRWISSCGFRARILYDRTYGLPSPTNIQLESPRIIPLPFMNDGIWRLFCERKSDSIIDSIKSGVYRPNDILEVIAAPRDEFEGDDSEGDESEGDESEGDESEGDESEGDGFEWSSRHWEGPTSLLTIASFFGDVKVVRFLLQQGARVDHSDFHVSGVRRSESDLHWALLPRFYYIEWEWDTMGPMGNDDRLDTARLLIDAGSDLDAISLSDVGMWTIGWNHNTIVGVVGNPDNFHWDAIQLNLKGSDLHLDFSRMDPSLFIHLVVLCLRIGIDISFTQPNGMTLLHFIIESQPGVPIEDGKVSLEMLIINRVDPCAVCDGYLTPTLSAFSVDNLDPWFAVLRTTGISVEAVAAHALGLLTESNMGNIIFRMDHESGRHSDRHPILCRYARPSNRRSIADDTKQLRADLIEAFEGQGCYLSESGDRGNTVTHKASSSVDFTPPTVYDPERANRNFRRRNNAQKHSQ